MKKFLPIALLLSLAVTGRATLMQVTGTFNGAPRSGTVTKTLSGSFTAGFDDSLVAATGTTTLDNLFLSSLTLTDPVIGARTFDTLNTFLDLKFTNGTLIAFTLGDFTNNVTSPGTDDFSMYFEQTPGLILSQLVIAEQATGFYGVDFRFNDATAGSFSVTPVPDAGSTAVMLALGCLGLVSLRCPAALRLLRAS